MDTEQQQREMLERITRLSGDLGKVAKVMAESNKSGGNSGERGAAAGRLRSELSKMDRLRQGTVKITSQLNRSSASLADSFTNLTGSAQEFSNKLNNILAGMVGGYLLGRLIDGATKVATTYQRLTEVGQTFNGSMMQMAQQAGAAGLTLEDFATLIERSSNAAAILSRNGSGGLGALALQVRKNTEQFGLYGMTMDQLNELTGDYVENLRLQGMLDQGTDASRVESIQRFAEEVSTFAVMTGKARRDIIRDAREALRDTAATSRLRATRDAGQRRALEQATGFLASLPGEAGTALSQMISQTFGYGTALFAEGARTFYEAGMGHIVSQFDRLGQRIARGEDVTDEMFEFAQEFADQVDAQREGLRLQAMAGNESARAILRQRDQMDAVLNLTEQQRRQMREQVRVRDQMTRFATSFNSVFSRIVGALRSGLFEGLQRAADALGQVLNSGDIEGMEASFKRFGETLGGFISDVLTPENIRSMGDLFISLATTVGTIVRDIFTQENLKSLAEGIGWFVSGVSTLGKIVIGIGGALASGITGMFNGLVGVFEYFKINPEFARIMAGGLTAMAAFATFMASGALLRSLMGRLGVVTMTAGVVNLSGGIPGMPGGGLPGGAGGGAAGNQPRSGNRIVRGAQAVGGAAVSGLGFLSRLGLAAGITSLGGAAIDGTASGLGMRTGTVDQDRDNANWERMSTVERIGSSIARGIESVGNLANLTTITSRAAEARIQSESEMVAGRNAPTNDRELSRLQTQYRRLEAQIEAERTASAYGGPNARLEQLLEMLITQRDQIARRERDLQERQVRATENMAP